MKKTLLVLGITFSLLMAQQSHAQTINTQAINTQDRASLIASITAQLQKLQAIMVVLNIPIDQIHQQLTQIAAQRTSLQLQKNSLRIPTTPGMDALGVANAVNIYNSQYDPLQTQIDSLNTQEQTLNNDLLLKIQYQVQD